MYRDPSCPIIMSTSSLLFSKDVKQENLVVTRDGTTKICDFGARFPLRASVRSLLGSQSVRLVPPTCAVLRRRTPPQAHHPSTPLPFMPTQALFER